MFLARRCCSHFCSCIFGRDWASWANFERIFSIYWGQNAGKICWKKLATGEKIATKTGKVFSFQPVPANWEQKWKRHKRILYGLNRPDFCWDEWHATYHVRIRIECEIDNPHETDHCAADDEGEVEEEAQDVVCRWVLLHLEHVLYTQYVVEHYSLEKLLESFSTKNQFLINFNHYACEIVKLIHHCKNKKYFDGLHFFNKKKAWRIKWNLPYQNH